VAIQCAAVVQCVLVRASVETVEGVLVIASGEVLMAAESLLESAVAADASVGSTYCGNEHILPLQKKTLVLGEDLEVDCHGVLGLAQRPCCRRCIAVELTANRIVVFPRPPKPHKSMTISTLF
jgi:hypothetical protein